MLCTCKGHGIRSIVRPCVEYACVVWNPHTARDCALLDAVQNRAARWIVRSHWNSETLKWIKSSKDCVSELNWPSLSTRRIFLICLFLFNVIHGQAISKLKDHLFPQSDITRSHKLSFQTISSTINLYRYSLLVNGIFLWNKIPSHVLEAGNSISNYTRHTHHLHYIPPSTSTTYFQKSFFPRTITDWNNLPDNIIESDTLQHFILSLKSHNYN